MKRFVFVLLLAIVGCTSATQSQFSAYGHDFHVRVFCGDKQIGDFHSSGKVLTEEHSDGWYFTDRNTRTLVRISGTVIIEQE